MPFPLVIMVLKHGSLMPFVMQVEQVCAEHLTGNHHEVLESIFGIG
jgi:hypothetical protein